MEFLAKLLVAGIVAAITILIASNSVPMALGYIAFQVIYFNLVLE